MILILKFCFKKIDMEGEEMVYRFGWKERRIKFENICEINENEIINLIVIKLERIRV